MKQADIERAATLVQKRSKLGALLRDMHYDSSVVSQHRWIGSFDFFRAIKLLTDNKYIRDEIFEAIRPIVLRQLEDATRELMTIGVEPSSEETEWKPDITPGFDHDENIYK